MFYVYVYVWINIFENYLLLQIYKHNVFITLVQTSSYQRLRLHSSRKFLRERNTGKKNPICLSNRCVPNFNQIRSVVLACKCKKHTSISHRLSHLKHYNSLCRQAFDSHQTVSSFLLKRPPTLHCLLVSGKASNYGIWKIPTLLWCRVLRYRLPFYTAIAGNIVRRACKW